MIVPLRWFMRAILAPLATVLVVALATAATTRLAAAQNPCLSCPNDHPPTVSVTPVSGAIVTPTVDVVIGWCDDYNLRETTRQILLNGAPVTPAPGFIRSSNGACGDYGESRFSIPLAPGTYSLDASIQDYAFHTGSMHRSWTFAQPPEVTPDGATRSVSASSAQSEPFHVKNSWAVRATFALTATCDGAETCGFTDTSIDLDPGEQRDVAVPYTSGAAGSTGTVTLKATFAGDNTVFDVGSILVVSQGITGGGISPGGFHTCSLDAAGKAFCWGWNGRGQIGNGTVGGSMLAPTAVSGGLTFTKLSAGWTHNCGLVADGSAYCWGQNDVGELGDGTLIDRYTPVRVGGGFVFTDVVATHGSTSCGLTSDGTAYCWGYGNGGRLGTGTTTNVTTPTPMAGGLHFASLGDGYASNHHCGITTSGDTYCWGANGDAQLGDGNGGVTRQEVSLVPVKVAGNIRFSHVSLGYSHTCALSVDGVPYCWGMDYSEATVDLFHVLGLASAAPDRCFNATGYPPNWCAKTPQRVAAAGVYTTIAARASGACLLDGAGQAWCWGHGQFGSNGDSTWAHRDVPVAVAGGHRFTQIVGGGGDHCALSDAKQAYCWGTNDYGKLGDGTLTPRNIPTAVREPGPVPGFITVQAYSTGSYPSVTANKDTTSNWIAWDKGTLPSTVLLSVECIGAISNCVPSVTSIPLAAGATQPFTVSYRSGRGGGYGLMKVNAQSLEDPTAAMRWTYQIRVVDDLPVTQSVAVAGAGIERGLCLTIGAGHGGAYECGDLRLAHSLPAVRTLNKSRSPTLLYNSAHAHPFPIVGANVALAPTDPATTSITATLKLGSVTRATGTWAGSQFVGGATKHIAIGFDALADATGSYAYTLELKKNTTAGPVVIRTDTGHLVIVNRKASAFGAGWWMAGLEQLVPQGDGSLMYVGGDGSLRFYAPVAGRTDLWQAPQIDRRDFVRRDSTGQYVLLLPHGVTARFNSGGQHVTTVNRVGHTTTFDYDPSSGRLASIAVPYSDVSPTYRFVYDPAGRLSQVIAPPLVTASASIPRVVTIADTSGLIRAITDPDTTTVRFVYDPSIVNRVAQRVNRLNDTTLYFYNAGRKLSQVSMKMRGAGMLTSLFTPQETRGMSGVASDTASCFTLYDGPRTDVPDVTKFWLDRKGLVQRVENALGKATVVERADARWPGLVTQVTDVRGQISRAVYDDHGNVLIDSVLNPYGDGKHAVTMAVWNKAWDFVTTTVSATGEITSFGYDSDGNRIWQQAGTDLTRRATIDYYASGTKLVRATKAPLVARDSVEYDARGNFLRAKGPLGYWTWSLTDNLGRDTLVAAPVDSADTADGLDLTTRTISRTTYDLDDKPVLSTTTGAPKLYQSVRLSPIWSSGQQMLGVRTSYDAEGQPLAVSRWSTPDPARMDTATTRWTYDAAGRKLTETAPDNAVDKYAYDQAGNLLAWTTRRNLVVRMAYDTLNRLKQRITPQATYAQWSTPVGVVQWTFPHYPNNGTGLLIPADTARYTYDDAGATRGAYNGDAQVDRSYYPNGALKTETQRIRTYSGNDFTKHIYVLGYSYDIGGRRIAMTLPQQFLFDGQDSTVTYEYDQMVGALSAITDVTQRRFTFDYDAAGRPAKTQTLGFLSASTSISETYQYDDDGRRTRRLENTYHPVGSGFAWEPTHDDRYTYDARGKSLSVTTLFEDIVTGYSGLGAVIGNATETRPQSLEKLYESWTTDALGNQVRRLSSGRRLLDVINDDVSPVYQPKTGRQVKEFDNTYQAFSDSSFFNAAGDREQRTNSTTTSFSKEAYYYGADGKLRVADTRACSYINGCDGDNGGYQRWIYEEYRYDALGRRVLARSSRDQCGGQGTNGVGAGDCFGNILRTVWDGDEILYEIRYANNRTTTGAAIEVDTAVLTSTSNSRCIRFDPPGSGLPCDPNVIRKNMTPSYSEYFGQVRYLHGGGIDHPLLLQRYGFETATHAGFVLLPHQNWRGLYDGGEGFPGSGPQLDWPGARSETYLFIRKQTGPSYWAGSLIGNKQDGSGQLYMRNRYYDPKSGRFTQEDPIGLAGGVNAYGFAAGDPVNYSDPFGLTACTINDTKDCKIWTVKANVGLAKVGAEVSIVVAKVNIEVGPDLSVGGKLTFMADGRFESEAELKGGLTAKASGSVGGVKAEGKIGCEASTSGATGCKAEGKFGAGTASGSTLGVGAKLGLLSVGVDLHVVDIFKVGAHKIADGYVDLLKALPNFHP